MRILLANTTAYPRIGGVENSLRFIGRELLAAGHEVRIFCFQTGSEEPLRCVHQEIEILRCRCPPCRWPHHRILSHVDLARRESRSVLEDFRPDAVWSRSAAMGAGIAQSSSGVPLFQVFCTNVRMDCRGLYGQTSGMPLKRRLMLLGLWPLHYHTAHRVERSLLQASHAVVFSENMRTQLRCLYGHAAAIPHLIPPGVDTDVFSPAEGARLASEVIHRYDLDFGAPHILYVGRLSAAKNLPLLIDAVGDLRDEARLVLVGEGPEEERLRAHASRRGIADRIVFAGPQTRLLPGFYSVAKVCVLPTTIESFGQVYLESLACGTPVVGFAGDGRRVLTATTEIIRDGETGRIAREPTVASLEAAIDDVLNLSSADYERMSKRAVEDVSRRYHWGRFVEQMLSLVGQI